MRSAAAAGALLVAACAPRAAEPLHEPAASGSASERPRSATDSLHFAPEIRAPRPDVTFPPLVPDLAEEPRWPLTAMQHPSLQPSYDVADALAEPGITWTELCARNVDHRRDPAHRDELIYLGGWCAAQHNDAAAAVGLLVQVRGSAVPGIARSVGFDIANILVDSQDEEHADQLLVQAQARSTEQYDLLAAAYFEIGRTDDARRATGAALQLDAHRSAAATCHRLARSALLAPEASRGLVVEELSAMAHRDRPDPTCVALATDVSCVVDPPTGCTIYDATHQLDRGMHNLAYMLEHWDETHDWQGWMGVAMRVHLQGPHAQTLAMESGALDAAVVATECDDQRLRALGAQLDRFFTTPHAPGIATRLQWAQDLWKTPAECAKFRTQWLTANPQ